MIALLLALLVAGQATSQPPGLVSATILVQREAFYDLDGSGEYDPVGSIDAVGRLDISLASRTIVFMGLRAVRSGPGAAEEANARFHVYRDAYTIRSAIRSGPTEYAFEAINENLFGRTLTGKLQYAVAESGLVAGIVDCQFDEYGHTIRGVMNRYSPARSNLARALLERFDRIDFGQDYVGLDIGGMSN
jgi:hypothetical protein